MPFPPPSQQSVAQTEAAAAALETLWRRLDDVRLPSERCVVVNLMEANWNRFVLRCILARYAAQIMGARLVGVCTTKRLQGYFERRMVHAFGIHNLFDLEQQSRAGFPPAFDAEMRALMAQWPKEGETLRATLRALRIADVTLGDLVYDEFLWRRGRATVDQRDHDLEFTVVEEARVATAAARLFRTNTVCALVGFDLVGREGYFSRHALARTIPVLSEDGAHPVRLTLRRDGTEARHADPVVGTVHDSCSEPQAGGPSGAGRVDAVRSALSWNGETPIVAILAQSFGHWPHAAPLLFDDHWQWLRETLAVARQRTDARWLLVPDPNQALLDELWFGHPRYVPGGERIAQAMAGAPQIQLCPAGVAPEALSCIVDGLVTGHHPLGPRFAAEGVPVLLAGDASYAGFGFTIDAADRAAFLSAVSRLPMAPRLAPEAVRAARAVHGTLAREPRLRSSLLPDNDPASPFDEPENTALLPMLSRSTADCNILRDELYNTLKTLLTGTRSGAC